jgi:hypothetical protein
MSAVHVSEHEHHAAGVVIVGSTPEIAEGLDLVHRRADRLTLTRCERAISLAAPSGPRARAPHCARHESP